MKKDKMDFHYISSPELREVAQKIYDIALQVEKNHRSRCTPFLNPAEIKTGMEIAKLFPQVDTVLLEGSSHDERKLLCLYPSYSTPPQARDEIALLHLWWDSRFGDLEHGDCLGALLSLGLRRDALGDIRMGDSEAFVFALPSVIDYILSQLTKIRRQTVKVEELPLSTPLPPLDEGKDIQVILTSLRLDSFLAAVFHLSRTLAQKMIQEGLVQLNYCACTNPSSSVEEGSRVSLRGTGRALFREIMGKTGKDRFRIDVRLWKR